MCERLVLNRTQRRRDLAMLLAPSFDETCRRGHRGAATSTSAPGRNGTITPRSDGSLNRSISAASARIRQLHLRRRPRRKCAAGACHASHRAPRIGLRSSTRVSITLVAGNDSARKSFGSSLSAKLTFRHTNKDDSWPYVPGPSVTLLLRPSSSHSRPADRPAPLPRTLTICARRLPPAGQAEANRRPCLPDGLETGAHNGGRLSHPCGEYTVYDRANYATSLKIWLAEAGKGCGGGVLRREDLRGRSGNEPDYKSAASWYEKAAAAGHSASQSAWVRCNEKRAGRAGRQHQGLRSLPARLRPVGQLRHRREREVRRRWRKPAFDLALREQEIEELQRQTR